MADMGGTKLISPTPGSTVTITIDASVPRMLAVWTAGEAETVVISGTPIDGQSLMCLITNDVGLGRVITFGTGFSPAGVATGIVSKRSMVTFIASGGTFYEACRTIGVLS